MRETKQQNDNNYRHQKHFAMIERKGNGTIHDGVALLLDDVIGIGRQVQRVAAMATHVHLDLHI